MIPNRPKLSFLYRYEDCPGGWKTLLALVWVSETRPLTGPKRVLVPRTRAGHGSGFGLFPRSAASVFPILLSSLSCFGTSSPLQGLASIASAWEFFFTCHGTGLNTDRVMGHWVLVTVLASAAHHWAKSAGTHLGLLEQDAWHGTWERICIHTALHGWVYCITLDTLG